MKSVNDFTTTQTGVNHICNSDFVTPEDLWKTIIRHEVKNLFAWFSLIYPVNAEIGMVFGAYQPELNGPIVLKPIDENPCPKNQSPSWAL